MSNTELHAAISSGFPYSPQIDLGATHYRGAPNAYSDLAVRINIGKPHFVASNP
jgi:hypothetical protein